MGDLAEFGANVIGAHARNKWNKEKIKAARDGLKYPANGKAKVTDSPLYGAANPTWENLGNDQKVYDAANGRKK